MATFVEYFLNGAQKALNRVTAPKAYFEYNNTNYVPISKEIYEKSLKVKGQIPKELNGAYIRNGQNNPYFKEGRNHLFDGDGMLHSIKFKDGQVQAYNNHYIRTDVYNNNKKWGHNTALMFANIKGPTYLLYSMIEKLRWRFGIIKSTKPKEVENHQMQQGNINVQLIAGKLLALHEQDLPLQVRLLCNGIIETLGYIKVGENKVITAHPHTDLDTNETFYQSYILHDPCFIYGYIDAKGYTTKPLRIDLRHPIMSHDMSITKKYVIFMELPLFEDLKTMMKERTFPYQFKKNLPSRFGLLPRYAKSQDEIVWFTLPSQFIFHVGNSWDIEGRNAVRMYACRYDDFSLDNGLVGLNKKEETGAYMCEYTFDLDTKACEERIISNESCEFPQVNLQYFGKPCRYIYSVYEDSYLGVPHMGGIVKYDVSDTKNLKKEIVNFGPNRFGGEMSFAPKHENQKLQSQADEDDGYLMGYVHDYNTNQSSFVIYDAKLKSKEPLAEIILPQRVPFGLHGNYLNSQQLKTQLQPKSNIELTPY